ncbi:MAG TPA: HYR domain-containing protein [Candidatus Acidoferrales bacterium]
MNPINGKAKLLITSLLAFLFLLGGYAQAQTVTTTVAAAAGAAPVSAAVNPVTNKVYVLNAGSSSVTVIDGATNNTTTVPAGLGPVSVAVNPVTNQVYVANKFDGNMTVIDGATNTTTTVPAGTLPVSVAVNPVTNKVYVANKFSANVTVFDVTTNTTRPVRAGTNPVSVAVNAVTNKVYVANISSVGPNVTVIDGATNTTTTVPAGTSPASVAVNPVTNQVYVVNTGSNSVTVIDGKTDMPTATVTAGSEPVSVAVNPVTNKVYVANSNSADVTVIDGLTNKTTTVVAGAGTTPNSVAVNPVTNKVYVANFAGVTVIDGATNTTTPVRAGTNPAFVAVNPVTNNAYVANGDGNVTVIDGDKNPNTTTTVGAGSNPSSVAVNPLTNKIYVANNGSANVMVIDGATNTTTTVSAGSGPNSIAVNPVTNKVYVANNGSNNVTVIDGATNATANVSAGSGPNSIAVNPVTNKIYVASSGSNDVTVIDGATNMPTATVAVGTGPNSIAVNPVTNKVYVANNGSANVTVIDGATNATANVSAGSGPNSIAVNPVTNKIYVANTGSANVTVIDGATNTTATVGAGTSPLSVAVNPVTNQVYVANGGSNDVTVLTEQQVQAIRLTTTISTLPKNQTTTPTPAFTFTASSTFSPTAPPVDAVYFQLDTWQGAWTLASPAGTPGSFTATLPTLSPGIHILYAYATDGQDASSIQTGGNERGQSSPLIGNIAAYLFLVTSQTTSTTPPSLSLPTSITAEATGPSGAAVTFAATATDVVDGTDPVTCSRASGSIFPLGTTTVTCSATDSVGNTSTGSFTVTVADTTPPTLQLPSSIIKEATGPSGAVVSYGASATDNVDGPLPVTCSPASGSTFPLGVTVVTCSATDKAGNTSSGSFIVTVQDTTPPVIAAHPNIVVVATSTTGALVTYTNPTATDLVDGTDPVTCSPASGANFPTGITTVTCKATDAHGNQAATAFTVTVTDFSLGVISPITVSVGGSASSSVAVNSLFGFSSAVGLSVTGAPTGGSASLSPGSVTSPGSSTLTVNLLPTITPSTFMLTVTGAFGTLTHSTTASVTVTASTSSIGNVIGQLLTVGCIDNSGIGNALTSKLSAAQAAISAGDIQTAVNILTALKSQLQAQSGKHIATSCTTVLLIDVQSLIDSLKVGITPNPVTGYVVDSSGLGLSGATVSIMSAGNTVATATTDITGFYFFPTTGVLTAGSIYTVQVSAFPAGFTTSTPPSQTFTWQGAMVVLSDFLLN